MGTPSNADAPLGFDYAMDDQVSDQASVEDFELDLDTEQVRVLLQGRLDDIRSGRVKAVSAREAFARLRAKSEARRQTLA